MSKELTPLEALEELRYRITNFNGKFCNYNELMGTIETALKEYEGAKNHIKALNEERIENSLKLKALEIIKEKMIDVTTLLDCLNAKEYNRWVPIRSHYTYRPFEITQEEYDLLKEALL